MERNRDEASIEELRETLQAEMNLSDSEVEALDSLIQKHVADNSGGPDPLWDINDVSDYLKVSKRTAETLVAEGKISPIWVKGQRRFGPDAVKAYLRRQVGQ